MTTNPLDTKLGNQLLLYAGGNEAVALLLWHSVGRIIVKRHGSANYLIVYSGEDAIVRHVADWLSVSVAERAGWLDNVDENGCPKKMLKFGSLEAVNAEADKWMLRRLEGTAAQLVEGEEELHFELEDGWTVVRLLSSDALDRESFLMQHCIGHGSYDARLAYDGESFLSLRDPRGMPHVTMHVCDSEVVQFQGKQNREPLEEYIRRCFPFFAARPGYRCPECILRDTDGNLHTFNNLPDVLKVEGDVAFGKGCGQLPRTVEASGSIFFRTEGVLHLPSSIKAGLDLKIFYSTLETLPRELEVGRDLVLIGCNINNLPDGLTVNRDLQLSNARLATLPGRLWVGRTLNISHTPIGVLPTDLKCGGIDFSHTNIRTIDTGIFHHEALPEVIATHSPLESITGKPLFKRLAISATKMRSLPQGLTVDGLLGISQTRIEKLGKNNRVVDLDALDCDIQIEPVHIAGRVNLYGSKVRLPENFRCEMLMVEKAEIEGCTRVDASAIHATTPPAGCVLIADKVLLLSGDCLAIEGEVVARKLHISPNVVKIGDGIRAEQVVISNIGAGGVGRSMEEVRSVLAEDGNLRRLVPVDNHVSRSSGKSTLLSSLLYALHEKTTNSGRSILTIEDPPEYQRPRLTDYVQRGL